jgi:hypothetical protein
MLANPDGAAESSLGSEFRLIAYASGAFGAEFARFTAPRWGVRTPLNMEERERDLTLIRTYVL